MPRVTKAMLAHQNVVLRSDIRQLSQDLSIAQERATLHIEAYNEMRRHLRTMTEATERVTDALSHTIGYVTDPKRVVQRDGVRRDEVGSRTWSR